MPLVVLLPKAAVSEMGLMGFKRGADVPQMVTTGSGVLKDMSKEISNWTWVEKYTNS